MTDAPKPLASLYGKGHVDAVRTRECVAMPGLRKQEILTPPSILDPLIEFWGDIALDPCSDADGSVPAQAHLRGSAFNEDGLAAQWPDGTFVNPPYGKLKDWLGCVVEQLPDGERREIVMLIPVRSHRKWWRAAAREASEVLYLNPIKFVGYDQAFPAPLCLFYFGSFCSEFREAFAAIGCSVVPRCVYAPLDDGGTR